MSYLLIGIAGAMAGVATPPFWKGNQRWQFWVATAAITVAYFAGALAAS